MKIGAFAVPVSAQAARLEPLELLGAYWVRFGNEVLLYAEDAKWNRIQEAAYQNGLDLKERGEIGREQNLHLVIQLGQLFQIEHPDVSVLFDKGRYLVVAIEPERAHTLSEENKTCYTVQPLEKYLVVFDVRAPAAERRAPVAWIQQVVNSVSRTNFEADLTHLASYPTRYSTSTYFAHAATWTRDELDAMGYTTRTESIAVGSGTSQNVIAEKPGKGSAPRGLVLVTAHLDSINISGGPSAGAPGADDNGSGATGLLEIARRLKDHPPTHDLRFILFGGEEQGLIGSSDYVSRLSANDRARIRAVVNMDMIGTLNTALPTVLLEGAAVSQSIIDGLAEAAGTYTALTVQTSLIPYASDHVPFINAGLPAVLTIEGADGANGNIHTAGDTLDHINYDLALEILRMNTAYTASAVGKHGGLTMFDSENPKLVENLATVKPEEWIKILKVHYSGRYTYNGGASARDARKVSEARSGHNPVVLNNPVYNLDQPIFIEHPKAIERLTQLRFTLYIDIDGPDPLNVVSGTVAQELPLMSNAPHFIGRVTSDSTPTGGGRDLIVEDFSFQWPGTSHTIDKLEIHLTGGTLVPAAEVTFIATGAGNSYGPYRVEQESRYFHDMEVDVDREDAAVDITSYNTHTHPDRPVDLPQENLTLESAFAKAGIRLTRSSGSGTVIDTTEAGSNNRWNYQELHESMSLHWDAYANIPQWKMWIFQAELADSDTLGGVMFDGDINEPGGVDRQGTAVFTLSPFFHTAGGAYPQANPPAAQAAERELFFDLIHETGHTFNLAHSFQKQLGQPWPAPSWMPLVTDPQALSWMNYPDEASPGGGLNATWFYNQFRFRFDDDELLFMRHAPASFVQMGNSAWFHNHGRVARESLDRRLQLTLHYAKGAVEMGEPVFIELRLTNLSNQPVMVHRNMDPNDGFVEIAVTNPRGERRPLIPIDHTRVQILRHVLEPGDSIHQPVNMIMGRFGFPFKDPGFYRIEASYTNTDGTTAAAVMQLYVKPAASAEDMRTISELFNARIGRTLYVGGTRVLEDVNEKLDWVRNRLGERHPTTYYLTAARYMPEAMPMKIVDPQSKKLRVLEADPDHVARQLEPIITNEEAATEAMGRAAYREVAQVYARAAAQVKARGDARHAQASNNGTSLLRRSGGVSSVVATAKAYADRK